MITKQLNSILLGTTLVIPTAYANELRELSTDRPDTTESAYTVDAGHFQLEMELATWTRDGDYRDFSFGQLNFKMGWTTRRICSL